MKIRMSIDTIISRGLSAIVRHPRRCTDYPDEWVYAAGFIPGYDEECGGVLISLWEDHGWRDPNAAFGWRDRYECVHQFTWEDLALLEEAGLWPWGMHGETKDLQDFPEVLQK